MKSYITFTLQHHSSYPWQMSSYSKLGYFNQTGTLWSLAQSLSFFVEFLTIYFM